MRQRQLLEPRSISGKIAVDLWNRSGKIIVLSTKGHPFAITKLMPTPTARQLEQRAEEARAVAEQMRDPRTKRTMANLALSYERLAKHAAIWEAREAAGRNSTFEQKANRAA